VREDEEYVAGRPDLTITIGAISSPNTLRDFSFLFGDMVPACNNYNTATAGTLDNVVNFAQVWNNGDILPSGYLKPYPRKKLVKDVEYYLNHKVKIHYGRSWSGHEIEDKCICNQERCGLVGPGIREDCDQHGFESARTMRQIHTEEDCPGWVDS
jgi:hypothetical protein